VYGIRNGKYKSFRALLSENLREIKENLEKEAQGTKTIIKKFAKFFFFSL
jgi:hypothetical protein